MDLSVLTPKVVYEFGLRWLHFLAGITWIGLLYWFNLVNVNFQKNLDPETKAKVNPLVIPQTLFYFRWAAALTWISGFLYYLDILGGEPNSGLAKPLIAWLVIVGVAYIIMFNLIRPDGALNNGNLLAVLLTALVVVASAAIFVVYRSLGVVNNSSYAIGIGGAIGTFMLFNVWGIIWVAQKRVLGLAPLKEGQDKAKLARRAFLASRANAWMSVPLLFFMGASSHLNVMRWY